MIDVNKAMAFIHVTPTVYQHCLWRFFPFIYNNKNQKRKKKKKKSDLVLGPDDAHNSEKGRRCLQQWQVTCRQQSIC